MREVNGFSKKTSRNLSIVQLLVRVPEIDALQEKAQLLSGNLCCFSLVCRPGKLVLFQALQPQTETVLVPIDDLQNPSVLVTEEEQIPFEWIHVKVLGDDDRKPVDLLSHVGGSWLHEHPDLGPIKDHPRLSKAWMSSPSSCLSKPCRISMRYLSVTTTSRQLFTPEKKQSVLFNETGDEPEVPSPQEATIAVAAHQRAKRGRRPLPAD